jgi:hypothetical protein
VPSVSIDGSSGRLRSDRATEDARRPTTTAPVKRYFMLILLQVKKQKNL